MIQNESSAGAGCSVVRLAGARHFFAVAASCRGSSLTAQLDDALQSIRQRLAAENLAGSIVAQTVFLTDAEDQTACRSVVQQFYGNQLPATIYIPQPPCNGRRAAVEVQGIASGPSQVEIERIDDAAVLASHDGISWAHLAYNGGGQPATAAYAQSLAAFHSVSSRLATAGFRFDDVLRTWLYLGDITGMDGQTQRYRELNRARSDFYRNLTFGGGLTPRGWNKPVFPASTGIGTLGQDMVLSCTALQTKRDDVLLVPLENPRQTAAFDYSHDFGPESPKFARAILLAIKGEAMVFVSGTASITASETQYRDDLERQTQQTLDNIEALLSAENLHRHGLPNFGATLGDLVLARVYLKRQEDYAPVKAICRARLGETPAIYVQADICRPELLVEIEAIARCHA